MNDCVTPSERPVREPYRSPLDTLADELGAVAAQIEREATLRLTAAIADLRRQEAERELRFSKLESMVTDRLASLKDGAPGKDGRDGVDGAPGRDGEDGEPGKDGAPGRDGEDGKPGADGANGKDGADGADGAQGEPGQNGADGKDGRDGKDGADGRDGAAGKLPVARAWADGIHYAADVVTHAGSLYQALRDTAKEPPHADWICLAAAGRNGKPFAIRGTFSEGAEYRELDVVTLNGASFAAKQDAPGPCPGDGWQLIAMQGKRGAPGERGPAAVGERGPSGPKVSAMAIDDDGLLTLRNEDGSTVTCDLYPLLSKLGR